MMCLHRIGVVTGLIGGALLIGFLAYTSVQMLLAQHLAEAFGVGLVCLLLFALMCLVIGKVWK